MGLLKIANIVIFGPCLRWADMRIEGKTTIHIHLGGDVVREVVLMGDEDREFREMWIKGGPETSPMTAGSSLVS